jgi:hypothetical protein
MAQNRQSRIVVVTRIHICRANVMRKINTFAANSRRQHKFPCAMQHRLSFSIRDHRTGPR